MKSFSTLYFIPSVLVIALSLLPGYSFRTDMTIVEDLLRERTAILKEAYYDQINIEETERRLYQIETQPLLSSDIETLRQSKETEYDMVRDLTVVSVKKITKLYNYLSFQGELLWFLEGPEGNYTEVQAYGIIVQDLGTSYKLSEFYPLIP